MRLFVAIELPDPLKSRLNDVVKSLAELSRREDAEIKWVRPEQFHFTLKFLGNCEQDQLSRITAAITTSLRGVPAFDVRLEGLGYFPERGPLKILWQGVSEGETAMRDLAERIEAACAAIGFAKEDRPFSAHLTLGRAKSTKRLDALRAEIQARKEGIGGFTVGSVALIQSVLSSAGATYTALGRFSLTP